jgi:hypothetical protein
MHPLESCATHTLMGHTGALPYMGYTGGMGYMRGIILVCHIRIIFLAHGPPRPRAGLHGGTIPGTLPYVWHAGYIARACTHPRIA